MADDRWRFANDADRQLNKSMGAYGGATTPGVATRSMTGVQRGELLFHRPELQRPWRSASAQRHAEVVVAKELEIEQLTRRCTEVRSQLATANGALQRLQASNRGDLAHAVAEKEKDVEAAERRTAELRAQLAAQRADADHQLKAMRSQHAGEVAALQAKIKAGADAMAEIGGNYARQIDDVKSAAAREVDLVQQLCHARTAELCNELAATNEALRRHQERSTAAIADLQAESRRGEQRCFDQLRDQERRFEAMRLGLQGERQTVEQQRDRAAGDAADGGERLKVASLDLAETERRFRDWNARIASDLDQIYDYYAAMIREAGEAVGQASSATAGGGGGGAASERSVSEVYIPPRLSCEASARAAMDRIVERLHQLTLMKQQHTTASQALARKVRGLEAEAKSRADGQQRLMQEKEAQLQRLLTDSVDARGRQDRLEKALAEVREHFADLESRLSAAAVRLQFFNDDLAAALSNPAATVQPPIKDVTFALLRVEGAELLWDVDPNAAQAAMTLLNNTARTKMAQHGAYECFSDGTALLLAFHDPLGAVRFALEVQVWLMEVPWPPAVLAHHNTAEEFAQDEHGNRHLVFRGLRVATAIHSGDVELERTGLPVGVGEGRVHYFGRTVVQALHLASLAMGGQTVVSKAVWLRCQSRAADIGSPVVDDLGDHRLSVALRASGTESGSGSASSAAGVPTATATTEVITLVQLLPPQLRARKFSRQAMFDARKHLQAGADASGGVAPQLSHLRRTVLGDEVAALKARHLTVTRAVEALEDEARAVATTVEALGCRLKEAQAATTRSSVTPQAATAVTHSDLAALVTTLDRVVARSDAMRGDLGRTSGAQKELSAVVKALGDTLALHSRISLTEDDFRKRIDVANDRCNERIYEANVQCEGRLQQLRTALTKSEQLCLELRHQLLQVPPAGSSVGGGRITGHLAPTSTTKSAPASGRAVRPLPAAPTPAAASSGSLRRVQM